MNDLTRSLPGQRAGASSALTRLLRRVFVGHSRGASFVEYLLICGILALGLIKGFHALGERADRKVARQAETVRTLGMVTKPPVLLPGGGSIFDPGVALGPKPPGKKGLPVIQPAQCFAEGTPVLTEQGERAIEAVLPGERVWARDEATGSDRLATVVRTFETRDALVIGVQVPFDVGRSELLRVTPDHPFWVSGHGWVAAQQLDGAPLERASLGDGARQLGGLRPLADAIESRGERASVYNLEVEGLHTYFVGRARVLVHNACGIAVKTYDEWKADPNRPANTQVHHLNQDAVYGTGKGSTIPRGQGYSIPLTGTTSEPGTEHYKFHRSLENFWDQYREGGALEGKRPTNAQYGAAVEKALLDAGFSAPDAKRIADGARFNRIQYGHKDGALVPRIPGAFMGDDPDHDHD